MERIKVYKNQTWEEFTSKSELYYDPSAITSKHAPTYGDNLKIFYIFAGKESGYDTYEVVYDADTSSTYKMILWSPDISTAVKYCEKQIERALPSRHQLNDKVSFQLSRNAEYIMATIVAVKFTESKVFYDIELPIGIIVNDIDSALIS